jgi:hypothetical protein
MLATVQQRGFPRNVAQSTGAIKNAGGGHLDLMTVALQKQMCKPDFSSL